jgi:acyl-CoA synthetase (AMP-forming)/AMP-acid ligase II
MVENALFADPRLLDCAVVGIPDKRLGELVGALVVPRKEWLGKLTEEEILEKVKHRSVTINKLCYIWSWAPAIFVLFLSQDFDLTCILHLSVSPRSLCHP